LRFHREVRAAAKLVHPNIVTAYDADEVDGIHFLVMQYIDGLDLGRLLKQRRSLPVPEAVDYVIQAAEGLEYAHKAGVVHRDIKPGNLLLDRHGRIRILDMGLAHIDDAADPKNLTRDSNKDRRVTGTYAYMAPESVDDPEVTDVRVDIYSLGCTLFHLVIGKRPFSGRTPSDLIRAHCREPIPSLRAVRTDIPMSLDRTCQRMLAKSPSDRHQSMAEIVGDLEACLSNVEGDPPKLPVEPPPSPSGDAALDLFLKRISHRQ
jgi:serine/threonine protein kinase